MMDSRRESERRDAAGAGRLRSSTLLLAGLLILAAGLPSAAPAPGPDSGKLVVQTAAPDRGLETPVSLDADDAFLPKVLAALAERSGYNVVAGPEVNNQQRISIHLKETPVEEAINLVVRAAGLSYEIVGRSFLVSGHDNLKKEVGLSPYLVELEYARASEVKGLLKDLSGNVQVDTGRNALLISTSPKTIAEVRRVVQAVDRPSKQIMLQTRVIEVSLENVERMGIDWEKLSKLTTIIAENPFDPAVGGRAPTEAEMGRNELGQLPEKMPYQKIDGLNNVGHFSRQLTAFNITIDWLLRNNMAKVLNSTKLTTMNNRPATIFVGEVVPFLVQSQETAQVEREEIGIKVEITPQINNDGFITAEVRPEVSTIFELIDGRIPRKKIRTASTTVLVRDQQKIFIAGLMSDESSDRGHELPFFGSLLYVGRWFSHQDRTVKKTDLVIEITPYILNNAEEVDALMADSLFRTRELDAAKSRLSEEKDRNHPGPTHLALLPAPSVLKPYQYVVSAHEISLGQHRDLQVTYTPWQNIGRVRIGVKHMPGASVALGAGWSHGNYQGESKYDLGHRFGLFLSKGFVDTRFFDWFGTLDLQLGEYPGFGAGTGIRFNFWDRLALLGEVSNNHVPETPTRGRSYWDPWATAAVRLAWPGLRGLYLDAGASLKARDYLDRPFGPADPNLSLRENLRPFAPMAYLDLAYAGFF
jgi:type IV pilus assembly protein PilQ